MNKRPRAPHGSKAIRITNDWFEDYCVREGGDGKVGIYLREFNVRLATFNANTAALQLRLKKLFDKAATPKVVKPKRRTRRVIDRVGGGAFMNDVGDQGFRTVDEVFGKRR